MKRSKLFIGITTALLAIAGVATARHFGQRITRFYCSLGGKCIAVSSTCTTTGMNQCFTEFATFTGGTITTWASRVYVHGPHGSPCSQTVCTTLVKYATEE